MRLSNTGVSGAVAPRLVLHKKNASPPSNAVRMVAAILGLELDFKEPDMVNYEHKSPAFKKINPMGTIPVLEDGNFILSESHAIILYLVDKYGGEHRAWLYPVDPQTRAIVNQCLFFDAFVVFRRLQDVAKPSILSKKPGPTEEDLILIDDAYATLEAYLESRRYVACDHVTVADVSLGSTVTAMQGIHIIDAERFPKTKGWLDRLEAEPYFKEVNEPGAKELAGALQHFWALNKKTVAPRLVLHKQNVSPPANAVRTVAAILGLELDYKELDLLNFEHKTPEFKKINPMGTIPVLEDGAFILSESHAIILYLVEKYGGEHKASLYPIDPQTRAIVNQCLFFDAFVVFRRLQDVAKPSVLSKKPGPTEEDLILIDDAYATLEVYLESRRYVACDHVTVADVSLGSTVAAMQGIHIIDAERFPKTKEWLDRLEAEPYFKVNEPGVKELAHLMKHYWALNKKSG